MCRNHALLLEKKALLFFSVPGAIAATTTGAAYFQRGVVVFSLPSSQTVLLTIYLELLPTHDGIRITLQISTTEKNSISADQPCILISIKCGSTSAFAHLPQTHRSGENRTQLQNKTSPRTDYQCSHKLGIYHLV